MAPVEPAPHASPIAAPGARHDLLVAWSSVALMLVAFAGVTVAGQGAVDGGGPGWLIALAVALFLLVMGLAVAAVVLGVRANRKGLSAGMAAVVVGGVIGGWFALTNLVGFVARFVFRMT